MKLFLGILTLLAVHTAHAEDGNWTDKIKMSGDLRFRHDYIQKEDVADRHRERIRLRLGATAKVNEAITVKIRLATADGADPISTNSTMTDNGAKKAFYVDLADINWKISDSFVLDLGKQENPLRLISGSQLMFDSDYTPEGASTQISLNNLFLKLAGFSLVERKPDALGHSEPDSWLMSAMAGFKGESESGISYLLAAGYHDFSSLKNNSALTSAEANNFYGNSATGARYDNDYKVVEVMAETQFKMTGKKLTVYVDGISNTDVTEENMGLLAGLAFNILNESDKPDWTFMYNYRTVEKDATVSVINDSDFASGHDGANGHTLGVGKAVMENAQLSLSYFIANVDNAGSPYSTQRGFVDFQVSF